MQDTLEDSFFFLGASLAFDPLNELEEALLNSTDLNELLKTDLNQQISTESLNIFSNSELISASEFPFETISSLDTQATLSSFSDMSYPETPLSVVDKQVTKRKVLQGRVEKSNKDKNNEATKRYRSKKQEQRKKLFDEVDHYEKLNKELKAKIEDIQTEVNLIKSLLVQVFLAKK